MIQRSKTLGLALIAVFAVSATVAGAAQANSYTAGANPAFFTGEQIEHEKELLHVFTAGLRKVSCSKATFSGTSGTPATTLTVTPTYETCASATFPATVTMNGCDYLFNEPSGTPFTSTVNLECPAGQVVEVHIYTSAANHTGGTSVCTITVMPFKNLGTNTYTNNTGTPDDVRVTSVIKKIPIKIDTASPLVCGTATEGTYTGGTTVKAYEDNGGVEGNQVTATVS